VRWRVYLVVGGLLLLLLLTAGTTTTVRLRVTSIGHRLTETLRPAQSAAADLTKAYIDEETGERGFLLTNDLSFLEPYNSGELAAANARSQLTTRFADDTVSTGILADVGKAAVAWRTQVSDPEIAAFKSGSLTGPALVASVGKGRELFNALRVRLSDLQERINQLVSVALQDSSAAQTAANDVTIAAAIAAIVLASLAIWQLRTSFARPLNRLVTQVRRVSGGDLDHSVDVSGPLEVRTVGGAVEAMRTRILAESARSACAAQQVAKYEEAERIASSLGDTVIRQLFTTSLALQSAASRYPVASPVLASAIRDIDKALKDLQSAIFELTSAPGRQPLGNQVLDLVDQLEAGLGAAPEVQLVGGLDSELLQPVAADVVAVVRDVVSAVVRPAGSGVSLSTNDGQLRLRITGGTTGPAANGAGALAGARARAERLGGSCVVQRSADTVTVNWQVPVPSVAVMPPETSLASDS
jgi:CHASE3 domain sensor protein